MSTLVTFRGVFRQTFSVFGEGLKTFYMVAGAFALASLVGFLAITSAVPGTGGYFLWLFVQSIFGLVSNGALIHAASDRLAGTPQSWGSCYSRAFSRFPALLGMGAVFFLGAFCIFVAAGILLGVFSIFALAQVQAVLANPTANVGQLILLFLIWMAVPLFFIIWLGTSLSLTSQAILLSGLPVFAAMGESYKRVRRIWWRIFAVVFVITVATVIAELATLLIQQPTAVASGAVETPLVAAWSAIVTVVIGPLIPIAQTVIFRLRDNHSEVAPPAPAVSV